MTLQTTASSSPGNGPDRLSRRRFLAGTGVVTTTMFLRELFPGRVVGQDPEATVEVAQLPRRRIVSLMELTVGRPVHFTYPGNGLHSACFLVKLGSLAGGGVGPEQDIVAFSSVCSHMGGDLSDGFREDHGACVCPAHLTSFDLNRHGMVIAGQATQSLPQILLELNGNEILAVGIAGLVYGHATNPTGSEDRE